MADEDNRLIHQDDVDEDNRLIHKDDVTPSDIKGRGGHTTNDPNHIRYLDYKDFLRRLYLLATSHQEKRAIQQMLVDFVHQNGGRFLRKVSATHYIELTHEQALDKCAASLRQKRVRHDIVMGEVLENVDVEVHNIHVPMDMVDDDMDMVDDAWDDIDLNFDIVEGGLNFLDDDVWDIVDDI